MFKSLALIVGVGLENERPMLCEPFWSLLKRFSGLSVVHVREHGGCDCGESEGKIQRYIPDHAEQLLTRQRGCIRRLASRARIGSARGCCRHQEGCMVDTTSHAESEDLSACGPNMLYLSIVSKSDGGTRIYFGTIGIHMFMGGRFCARYGRKEHH